MGDASPGRTSLHPEIITETITDTTSQLDSGPALRRSYDDPPLGNVHYDFDHEQPDTDTGGYH